MCESPRKQQWTKQMQTLLSNQQHHLRAINIQVEQEWGDEQQLVFGNLT